jgi:two-component system, NtrC family, sensor kinase
MRRRSKTGREPVKARRDKAAPPKRRNGPKAMRRRRSAAAGQETKVALLSRELAVEQQAATAKVLQVISSSTFDLQTLLNALVEAGMHLCEADVAAIWRPENGVLKLAATSGMSNEFVEFAKQNPIMPGRGTVSGRVVLEGKTVHLPDVLTDSEFTGIGYQSSGKYRTNLGVPLLRKGQTIGAFLVARRDVRPFTKKQIKLVETFADQAVIAIENARLFEAEQQRTEELTESLKQQTATANVLRVIANCPTDIEPVLEVIVRTAGELCGSEYAIL